MTYREQRHMYHANTFGLYTDKHNFTLLHNYILYYMRVAFIYQEEMYEMEGTRTADKRCKEV